MAPLMQSFGRTKGVHGLIQNQPFRKSITKVWLVSAYRRKVAIREDFPQTTNDGLT